MGKREDGKAVVWMIEVQRTIGGCTHHPPRNDHTEKMLLGSKTHLIGRSDEGSIACRFALAHECLNKSRCCFASASGQTEMSVTRGRLHSLFKREIAVKTDLILFQSPSEVIRARPKGTYKTTRTLPLS
jgi:hypothetical protein